MRSLYAVLNDALGEADTPLDKKGEALFSCPKCRHQSSRSGRCNSFAVNIKTGKYQCWFCGFSGKPKFDDEPLKKVFARFFKKITSSISKI